MVMGLDAKPEDLSSVLRNHIEDGKNYLLNSCPLTDTGKYLPTNIHAHK